MKTQGRRKSVNIRDVGNPEDQARAKLRSAIDDYRSFDEDRNSKEAKNIQSNVRQAIQTTPEDAVKKTHERAYGR